MEPQRGEHRRVEHVGAVVLHERLHLRVPTLRDDLLVDRVARLHPLVERAPAGNRSGCAMRMARSSATQHIMRPYTNACRPPRVSQMPSSGWSQFSHDPVDDAAQVLPARAGRSPAAPRSACQTASSISPYVSSWSCSDAALPIRTGAEPGSPRSCRALYSSRSALPSTRYMICSGPLALGLRVLDAVAQPREEGERVVAGSRAGRAPGR